ncbi:hypothetical protein LJC17_04420 [Acholeplasma sp. OttesenSCG-928-E16]|nr:hypothetical protein [Acholeplasma sp. OttesenSCG-928-E16]
MKKMVSIVLLVIGLLVTSAFLAKGFGLNNHVKPVSEINHHELGIKDLGDPPFPPFGVKK